MTIPPARPGFRPLGVGLAALLVCFPGAGSRGADAVLTPAPADKTQASAPPDDGFTRESMNELGHPQPTPPPHHGSVAATTRKSTRLDPKDFASVPHRTRHRHPAPAHAQITVVEHRPRRNPLVSFVYWWNGFVIKTFHTNNGTVMLRTIGAKT